MIETRRVQCCIAGGGPAGMMLGLLLARAGVSVLVLEKHADFFRDFRGDTIHASTLQLMRELGLLKELLALPHQEIREVRAQIGDRTMPVADFSHLPTYCKFVALMPQWDFLNFLRRHAEQCLTFTIRTEAQVTELVREGDRFCGARATTPEGTLEVHADLVIGADGRHSTVRERARLPVRAAGVPIDVLWMRIPRVDSDPPQLLARVDRGRVLVMLDRGNYWQCAYVIRKGAYYQIQARGIDAFRSDIGAAVPFLANRVDALRDWNDIKLLTVVVDRLERWYRPGLLCIGDAAHAMSPIGGVGINLAIQDAVATANRLTEPLLHGVVPTAALAAVQRRREWPTWLTQRAQVMIQNRVIERVLTKPTALRPPQVVQLLARYPMLRRIPGYLVGVGVRPEKIEVRGLRHGTNG